MQTLLLLLKEGRPLLARLHRLPPVDDLWRFEELHHRAMGGLKLQSSCRKDNGLRLLRAFRFFRARDLPHLEDELLVLLTDEIVLDLDDLVHLKDGECLRAHHLSEILN